MLKRGPKFCPTTEGKISDFCGNTKIFSKRLIVQERFFDVPFNNKSLIREPSKKYITTNNKELTDIVSLINKINPESKNLPDNLSNEERKAMAELTAMAKMAIEIKKADKSNTLVLMNKD